MVRYCKCHSLHGTRHLSCPPYSPTPWPDMAQSLPEMGRYLPTVQSCIRCYIVHTLCTYFLLCCYLKLGYYHLHISVQSRQLLPIQHTYLGGSLVTVDNYIYQVDSYNPRINNPLGKHKQMEEWWKASLAPTDLGTARLEGYLSSTLVGRYLHACIWLAQYM